MGLRTISVIRERDDPEENKAAKDRLIALGADAVLLESEAGNRDAVTAVMDGLGGAKPMLGLNCVGGTSATNLVRMLGQGASLVTYGGMSRKPITLATSHVLFKVQSLLLLLSICLPQLTYYSRTSECAASGSAGG